jgi:hypothetical protein
LLVYEWIRGGLEHLDGEGTHVLPKCGFHRPCRRWVCATIAFEPTLKVEQVPIIAALESADPSSRICIEPVFPRLDHESCIHIRIYPPVVA